MAQPEGPPDRSADGLPWWEQGEEPDYRFSLANERTLLAWVRTSLALMAAGVAVAQLIPSFRIPGTREILAGLLVALGMYLSVAAYFRWVRTQLAMRLGEPLPHSRAASVMAVVLVVVGALAMLTVLLT